MNRVIDPKDSLPYFLRGAFREFETALGRHLESYKLPMSQFYILRLKWSETGMSQSEIASRAFMSDSVASQVIKRMTESGLLRRRPDPKDGRSRLVSLSSSGRTLREQILKEYIKLSNDPALDISSEEIKIAIEVLIKVQKIYQAYNKR